MRENFAVETRGALDARRGLQGQRVDEDLMTAVCSVVGREHSKLYLSEAFT